MGEFQILFNILGGSAMAALGWFAKTLWSAVQELKTDLAKLREELPKEYVPKNDWKDGMREIKDILLAISTKLDTKVDK